MKTQRGISYSFLALTLLCTSLMAANKPMQKMADCSSLSMDQNDFAAQLGEGSRLLFCNKFTADQRDMAMNLAGQPDAAGNIMTADQAVMKVARDNNMMMPMTPQNGAGGCPAQ